MAWYGTVYDLMRCVICYDTVYDLMRCVICYGTVYDLMRCGVCYGIILHDGDMLSQIWKPKCLIENSTVIFIWLGQFHHGCQRTGSGTASGYLVCMNCKPYPSSSCHFNYNIAFLYL